MQLLTSLRKQTKTHQPLHHSFPVLICTTLKRHIFIECAKWKLEMFPSCLAKTQVDSAQESCWHVFVRICLVPSLLLRALWQHSCHHHHSMPDVGCPCCCEKTKKEYAKIIIWVVEMLKRPSEAVVRANTRGRQIWVHNG